MPPRAAALSERLLAPLGRRWRHVEGVARRAGTLSSLASAAERPAVVTAAWLHDVGYAPEIVVTGLHPLDGARYLRSEGWPELVVCLVAHHTGAEVEAEERGLSRELAEFDRPPEPLLDLVTTADLTTSPDGEEVDPEQRLAEIVHSCPTPRDNPWSMRSGMDGWMSSSSKWSGGTNATSLVSLLVASWPLTGWARK